MNFAKVIERIYAHLEEDNIEKAVMGCLRIARGAKDYLNAAIFLRELYPEKKEVIGALHDDIAPLKPEVRQFILETSLNRWLDAHMVELNFNDDHNLDNGDKRNILKIAVGEIDAELDQWERTIADMVVPAGMSPFDAAAFTDHFTREKAQIRLRIKAIQTIRARLKARCLNYAIQMERQLILQQQSQGFLESVQNEVNNYFKSRSDDVYQKLNKAAQLAASNDLEDSSLLLTEVRRALKSAADYFHPPMNGKTICSDGVERTLGNDEYLNRLHEFLAINVRRSTSKDLLTVELNHLSSFMRRLNEMASKGVHASVELSESRQGLVGLYFFLYNMSKRL
ncbi:MAG: hypothetical protein ACLGQW_03915, partial [Acidobacteriota bacterium]